MTRLSSLAWLGAGVALAGISHGCTALLDIPEDVTAYLWCLDAEPHDGFSHRSSAASSGGSQKTST